MANSIEAQVRDWDIAGTRYGNTWGRPLPGVTEWDPPLKPLKPKN